MRFLILPAFFLLSCCLSAVQAQNDSPIQGHSANQAQLKAIKTPVAAYPEEARKNGIQGKVTLRIIVDERGKVSEAKVLSGPTELQSAALESVRMWQYEPPASGPVTETVEISYGFPKECPGPVSDQGDVEGSWRLRDLNGKVVAVADNDDAPPPRYLEEERKSGVAGELVLSVSLSSDGYVKEIRVIRSPSPALDERTADAVLTMRFRRIEADSAEPLDDLRLQFTFRATCNPRF